MQLCIPHSYLNCLRNLYRLGTVVNIWDVDPIQSTPGGLRAVQAVAVEQVPREKGDGGDGRLKNRVTTKDSED